MFFHLSPFELGAFGKAKQIEVKRKEEDMLLQATYIYEAFATVLGNAFGKGQNRSFRTKTYTQEWEEKHKVTQEKIDANGIAIMKNLELSMAAFKATHNTEGNTAN